MLKPCRIIIWRRYPSDPFKMWPRKISHCKMILLNDCLFSNSTPCPTVLCRSWYLHVGCKCLPFCLIGRSRSKGWVGFLLFLFFFTAIFPLDPLPPFFSFFFLSYLTIFMESVTTTLHLSEILCQSRKPISFNFDLIHINISGRYLYKVFFIYVATFLEVIYF